MFYKHNSSSLYSPALEKQNVFKTSEFNFGISFVCNGPDLNELLPKKI